MVMGGQNEQTESKCECRMKHREDSESKDLLNRLKRIEGQVRGIQGMVEEERYCVDILTQVAAIQSALNSFNRVLLTNHIKTCVVKKGRKKFKKNKKSTCIFGKGLVY